jgi:hypothetical protein
MIIHNLYLYNYMIIHNLYLYNYSDSVNINCIILLLYRLIHHLFIHVVSMRIKYKIS